VQEVVRASVSAKVPSSAVRVTVKAAAAPWPQGRRQPCGFGETGTSATGETWRRRQGWQGRDLAERRMRDHAGIDVLPVRLIAWK
jgi:hypothetical protein